jgi:hypothetical protein
MKKLASCLIGGLMLASPAYSCDKVTLNGDASLRQNIISYAQINYEVALFGKALDDLAKRVESEDPDYDTYIPEKFFDKDMHVNFIVNKRSKTIRMYDKDSLLLETKVALGGSCKDYSTGTVKNFGTPKGTFYIKRIVYEPWWYPPKWAKEKHAEKPGRKNPYGLWMAELCRTDDPINYDFSIPGDSQVRIHATNKPKSIGTYASHGCIRLHPDVADELFPALLRYTPHKDPKKNSRGLVYPLDKTIKIVIE